MIFLRRASRLVAALALAGASAATVGVSGQHARAASAPTHVAIAVDFGGGNAQVACAPAGGTGSDVVAARFTVKYNRSGLLVQINGVGSLAPPTNLYWSYWHSSGGSWSYATSGPATSHPAAGSLEGWAYNDGSVGPATPPSYAAICGGQDPVPPPVHPTTQAPSTRPATSAPPAPPARPGQPGVTKSAKAGSGTGSTSSAGTHSTSTTKAHTGRSRAKSSSGSPASSHPASDASQDADRQVGAKQAAKHTSSAPALGTALALFAAAGLGGTAFWRLRRQKHG